MLTSKPLDRYRVVSKAFKYFIFGISVALVVYLVPQKELRVDEVLMIAVYTSIIYAIFDLNNKSPHSFC